MHTKARLLQRLRHLDRPLAVVVGAPLSMTRGDPPRGVPDVEGMIAQVRARLSALGPEAEAALDAALKGTQDAARYQVAFDTAHGLLGGRAVNGIVRDAVFQARLPDAPIEFEGDGEPIHWHLPRGAAALGRLLAAGRPPFRGPVLTTNFDPLISLAVKAAGGAVDLRTLDRDGGLPAEHEHQGRARVVHLHGYWRSGHTLHTPHQLQHPRPHLGGALRALLRHHTVLVAAYGGWDDAFTKALAEAAAEPGDDAEVLWALFGDEAHARHTNEALLHRYQGHPAFAFYCGIDAHALFDELASPAATTRTTPAPASTPPPDERPIEMGQPGFAVPAFTAHPGTMIGGPALVAKLHDLLSKGGEAGIGQAAAVGLGGLGKSRLAWEYAHAHCDDYPGGVLWFDADPQSDLDGQLAHISRELRWVGAASDDKGALDVGRVALRELRGALIIFDNVEDLDRVRHLRPAGGCTFLVTSRLELPLPALPMECLDDDAGAALLAQVAGRRLDDADDRAAARDISHWAEGLPLALELVGAYLARRPTAGWAETRDRLREHALKARPLKPAAPGFEVPIHRGQTVEAALRLELRLFEDPPTLASVLDMLAGLGPGPMGRELLSALVNSDDAEALTEALAVGCLLRILHRVEGSTPRYRMHRLVREVHRSGRRPLDAAVMARLIEWFRARRSDRVGIEAFGGEGEHLEAARARCEADARLGTAAVLRWLEAYIAIARGQYEAAQRQVEQAWGALAPGEGDTALAVEIELDRAHLRAALGEVRDAVEMLTALAARLDRFEVSPETRVHVLLELANQQHLLNRNEPAGEVAAQAVHVAEHAWGGDHWRTAEARSQWAVYESSRGRSIAAGLIEQARRDFETLRSARGPADHRSLTAHDDLGNCLAAAGREDEAITMGHEVLDERARLLGLTHPLTLHALNNLAIRYNNVGRGAEAREHARRALDGYQRLYGPEHPATVDAQVQVITSTLGQQGQNVASVIRTLEKLRNDLRPDHARRSRIDRLINQLRPKHARPATRKPRRK